MVKLPRDQTKILLAIHGWSGILLGLVLYVVICTGVGAVFHEEINDWASPLEQPTAFEIPEGIDGAVRRLAPEVDPQYLEEVAIYRTAGGRVNALFHRHEVDANGKPYEHGVEYELDPHSWAALERRAGELEEIDEQRRTSAVADFLVNLHVRLHIPLPYGYFVTGVLGMVMMIAAITGLIVHRHLLKDLFTLRFHGEAVLRRRDLHVVAGTWNLPFAFILAFTGSFFSFATSVGLPALAMVQFNGDQEAMIDTLYGSPRPEDTRSVTPGNLDAMLAHARSQQRGEPYFVNIEDYGRADSAVTIYTRAPEGGLVGTSFVYSGATGEFLQEKPVIGTQPSVGSALVSIMSPLHFGDFAGAASKAVWVALGFAGAYVTLTGMLLWVRRREEQPAWRFLGRVVHYVGYGLPLGLACAPYGFFLLKDSDLKMGVVQGIVFGAVSVIVAFPAFMMRDLDRFRRLMLGCTGLALMGLPPLRFATGGMGWESALSAGIAAVPAVDLALLVIGAACVFVARRKRVPLEHPATTHEMASQAPAA